MENIILGRTGVNISRISLGTWSFGGANVSSNNQPVGWAGQSEEDSQLALQKAHEVGTVSYTHLTLPTILLV